MEHLATGRRAEGKTRSVNGFSQDKMTRLAFSPAIERSFLDRRNLFPHPRKRDSQRGIAHTALA
jgi:hypothetical protein